MPDQQLHGSAPSTPLQPRSYDERWGPDDVVDARLHVFRTWPSSASAACLLTAAGAKRPEYREEVMASLGAGPCDAVLFALLSLEEVSYAWDLANTLRLRDADVWLGLAQAYGEIEPLAVLPILAELVENKLTEAGARHYRIAAHHPRRMHELANGTSKAVEIGDLIGQLRETYRRRPRLQQEFDRAGLP